MPIYAYKGFDAAGKSVSGTREADTDKALKHVLKRDGVFLTELRETQAQGARQRLQKRMAWRDRLERVSTQDMALATRQLATLIGAGIPLVPSLSALIDQIENHRFKAIWASVKQRVNEGAGFGDALAEHERTFSGLYINMVRAGESSGALDVVLNRLADFSESQAELRSKLLGTMVYPVLMFFMAAGVMAMLFVFVIPKISRIFEAQKMALPLPTQLLIGVSHIAVTYGWLLVVLAVLGAYALRRYVRTERGRLRWHQLLLKMPIFGSLLRMIAITRFSKTLSTLLGSGVPLLQAFDIVSNVLGNVVLMRVIADVRHAVKEGESIAAPLKRSGEFPPLVTHMIDIGERSGQLEAMLENIARGYEVQVNARLQAMTSILEPLIIVVMGVVVACIVFAILMPMLQMSAAV